MPVVCCYLVASLVFCDVQENLLIYFSINIWPLPSEVIPNVAGGGQLRGEVFMFTSILTTCLRVMAGTNKVTWLR